MTAARRIWMRIVVSIALVALGLAAGTGAAPIAGATGACGTTGVEIQSGGSVTCTYSTVGEDTFQAPAGVTNIHVEAIGGDGVDGAGAGAGSGGTGADVAADVTVTPGATLYVDIGGGGQATGGGGGSGGDASDLRTCSQSTCVLPTGTDTRLLVAGGGGGGADAVNSNVGQTGGDGGDAGVAFSGTCAAGADGTDGNGGTFASPTGTFGRGGGCAAGGAAGSGFTSGDPGTAGFGGGTGSDVDLAGGGAGFFGGGASAEDTNRTAGGGGGGSSFAESSATNLSAAPSTSGAPSLSITFSFADLGIFLSAHPSPVVVGRKLTYVVTVENFGGATATGVEMFNQLPSNTKFIASMPSSGMCNAPPVGATGTITCSIGALAPGATWTAQIVVRAPTTIAKLVDTASVTQSADDPTPANNTVTLTTRTRRPRR